jgi:hypothetical protein
MKQLAVRNTPLALVLVAVLVGAATFVSIAASPEASAAPATQGSCPGNLLKNPNFDGGSRKTESLGTSLSSAVADGWFPWFVRGDATYNREPEFKVEQVAIGGDPNRVRSDGQSQKWFTTWGTHTAGVYQQVKVPSGATVTFTIHGLAYTGEDDGWDAEAGTFKSDPVKPGNYHMLAGIDPTGAVPAMGSHPANTVVWSPDVLTYDTWVPLSVTAKAQGGTVTVFAKGAPEWPVKHNDSWWEDACLVVGGKVASAPAQAAAAVPAATAGTTTAATTGTTGTTQPVVPAAMPKTGHALR